MAPGKHSSVLLAALLIIVDVGLGRADTTAQNLDKYRALRQRLVTEFVSVGAEPGQSQPAPERMDNAGLMKWGDGTIALGFYLGVLATEHYLLTNPALFPGADGNDPSRVDGTRDELYFALLALERLDSSADAAFPSPCSSSPALNGFFLRDDVPADFYTHFAGITTVQSDFIDPTLTNKEESQDQVYHVQHGLALVVALVPANVVVRGRALRDWAIEQAERITRHFAHGDWIIRNPACGNRSVNRGENARGYSYGETLAAAYVTAGAFTPTTSGAGGQSPLLQLAASACAVHRDGSNARHAQVGYVRKPDAGLRRKLSDARSSQARMPRQARRIEPGMTYHLISRFVDREWFIRTADERNRYLKLLGNALEDSDWRLMSYAIMSNHIHLGSVAGEQPLHTWVRRVHSPFADFMNRAYNRIGAMFVRGPKAYWVAPDAVGQVVAYIHNNPVRAGLCPNAAESTWTSHRAYVGDAPVPRWLHVSEGLARAGFREPREFDAWVNDPARAALDSTFSEERYKAEWQAVRDTARVARSTAHHTTAVTIVAAAANVLGLTLDQLRSSSRSGTEVLCRSVAVQCAMAAGISGCAIAEALGLSPQRVSLLRRQQVSREVRSLCAKVMRVERASLSSGA